MENPNSQLQKFQLKADEIQKISPKNAFNINIGINFLYKN